MRRRDLLLTSLAAAMPSQALAAPIRTRWVIQGSEGLDAVAFLGPMSGKPFYARYYENELAALRPAIPAFAQTALDGLQKQADAAGMLLWPSLATLLSGGPTDSLDDVIASVQDPESRLYKAFRGGPYWDEAEWRGFLAARPQLLEVFRGLKTAGFADYRRQLVGQTLDTRIPALSARFATVDVIAEQEHLLGRPLDPQIGVVLTWFSKPHGVRIQGQRFLNAVDYPEATILRVAAHEILHPPFAMDGRTAKAAMAVLEKDALFVRIVAEHDPSFGYNSIEGILNEDTVQALDQIISERLGVARQPADRWKTADDGMHVLAAGLYGQLKAEGYDKTGGNIERWLADAVRRGKLAPEPLHASAAQVLGLPVDRLWTPRKA